MAARYSKVERRIWRDERFRLLSERGKLLWLYLLTNDAQDAFPGLFVFRMTTAGDDLGWSPRVVQTELDKILALGMARFDASTSLLWLPKASRKRVDELRGNAKNAKGWRTAWDQVPQCPIAREAFWTAVAAIAEEYGGDDHATSRAFTTKTPPWVHPRMDLRIHPIQAAQPANEGSQDGSMDGSQDGSRREEKSISREEEREGDPTQGLDLDPPPPPPPASRWSERALLVGRTIRAHTDLFAVLTKQEVAPYVERIEKELAKVATVNPGDIWPDLESEVDSWVSHARKKNEGRGRTPTQVLGDVEDLARTRCRERNSKAREERDRGRRVGAASGDSPVTSDAWELLDRKASNV